VRVSISIRMNGDMRNIFFLLSNLHVNRSLSGLVLGVRVGIRLGLGLKIKG
jgi:hypothetical protein